MFRTYGPMHDQQLLEYVHDAEKAMGFPDDKLMSPSGVRSRRSELSKPNMERLDEIAREIIQRAAGVYQIDSTFETLNDERQLQARQVLRTEGFKSPLWDSGRRETVRGRQVIVWEIAQ